MKLRSRSVFFASGFVVLVVFAYWPVLRAGFLGEDFAVLRTGASSVVRTPSSPSGSGAAGAGPLASASLWVTRSPFVARAVNLALFLFGAWAFGKATRRTLLPWLGSHEARLAGIAGSALLVLHPLAPPIVASLAARGALLAFAFGGAAAAVFLSGRQERRSARTVLAALFCVAAGFAADVALALGPLLALLEFFSSHRYRPLRVRIRTALTTLTVFGSASALDALRRGSRSGREGWPDFVAATADVFAEGRTTEALGWGFEKLGLLVLPANPMVAGAMGMSVAGALFLIGMQPAFSAARTAPRLWGWILSLWMGLLLASFALHVPWSVGPTYLTYLRVLLPSMAVAAVGLGIASTAVSDWRRPVLPTVIGIGFALLGHANAAPWPHAARALRALRGDLEEARELHGNEAAYFLLDPPASEAGIEPLGTSISWVLPPTPGTARDRPAITIRSMDRSVFLAWLREPESFELRSENTVVLYREGDEASGWRSVELVAAVGSADGSTWSGEPSSPTLDIDALAVSALRVTVPSGIELTEDDRVGWSAPRSTVSEGQQRGVWIPGEPTTGIFDLGASLAWRLGGRIRSVRFEADLVRIQRAELLRELPGLGQGLVPVVDGDGWTFERPRPTWLEPVAASGRFRVFLFDVGSLTRIQFRVREEANRLVVPDAAAWERRILRAGARAVSWSLEFEVDGCIIARNSGRRVGNEATTPPESPPEDR